MTDVHDAATAARAAAERSGVTIRGLHDIDDIVAAAALLDSVWDSPGVMPTNLIRALSHSGNYVAGAFSAEGDGGDGMVGAVVGFWGAASGRMLVHSHILGVTHAVQGRSVGFALKVDQRAWALARGVDLVTWTFDPLVRRNAYFNLAKLAAVGTAYEPDFYGDMPDGINAGDETDRVVISWSLRDPDVAVAASGSPRAAPEVAAAAPVLLDCADDRPVPARGSGDILRCAVPRDIVSIRRRDPGLARRWRHAVRDTLGGAMSDGYTATAMDRDGRYVLTRTREAVT